MAVLAPDWLSPMPMNSRKTSSRRNVKWRRMGTPKILNTPTEPPVSVSFAISFLILAQLGPGPDRVYRSVRGPVQNPAGTLRCHLAIDEHRLAVHQHMTEAFRVLVRMGEIRLVDDRAGVEYGYVGLHARTQQAAVEDAESRCRQAGH